jgi:hypothetical protein
LAPPGAQAEPGDAPADEAIPGLLDQRRPLHYESSAEHKSSWPDEGGTGEAGAG